MIHLLTQELPPTRGGAGTYCAEMAGAAGRCGIPLTLWAPKGALPPDESRIALRGLPVSRKVSLFNRWNLRRFFRESLPPLLKDGDTIHLAEIGPLLTFMTFPRLGEQLAQQRLLVTLHGTEIPRFSYSSLWKNRFIGLLRKADRIHVLSQYNERLLLQAFPDLRDRILQIPGAPRHFMKTEKTGRTESKEDSTFELLSVARIHPRKGQDQLIRYLGGLPEDLRARVRLRLVGPIRRHSYFRSCVRLSRRLRVRTQFVHGCSDAALRSFYRRAEVFCLTSMPAGKSVEGFGLVNLEAAAFGLPVLAHDVGGIRETLLSETTGFLVQPGDQDAFLDALQSLIKQPDRLRSMGRAARDFSQTFTWEEAAERLYSESDSRASQSSRRSP